MYFLVHDDPVFGWLTDLIVYIDECWFAMQPIITTKFNEHYNAYEVKPHNDYILFVFNRT